jgi:hypothetical protein
MLTTIDKVKNYLKITDTSDDPFIADLLQYVQGIIENYCDRHFEVNTYTSEQHNIMHKIFPKEYPIRSVTSILRVSSDVIDVAPDSSGVTNYRVYPSYIDLLDYKNVTMTNKTQYINKEPSYVEITYQAGYDTDKIPFDLQMAAVEMTALKYKESRENRLGVEQESEGAVRYTYAKKDAEMPLTISCILDRYKKVKL